MTKENFTIRQFFLSQLIVVHTSLFAIIHLIMLSCYFNDANIFVGKLQYISPNKMVIFNLFLKEQKLQFNHILTVIYIYITVNDNKLIKDFHSK